MKKSLNLQEIFDLANPEDLEYELRHYLGRKRLELRIELTPAEKIFEDLVLMGGRVAGDGFVSLYCEWFAPISFARVCAALEQAGGVRLRDLLTEAWDIYTRGNKSISVEELEAIPMDAFNTEENMDRFDQIGEEVVAEIQAQYDEGKVWSVEYARLHRSEFVQIE